MHYLLLHPRPSRYPLRLLASGDGTILSSPCSVALLHPTELRAEKDSQTAEAFWYLLLLRLNGRHGRPNDLRNAVRPLSVHVLPVHLPHALAVLRVTLRMSRDL